MKLLDNQFQPALTKRGVFTMKDGSRLESGSESSFKRRESPWAKSRRTSWKMRKILDAIRFQFLDILDILDILNTPKSAWEWL